MQHYQYAVQDRVKEVLGQVTPVATAERKVGAATYCHHSPQAGWPATDGRLACRHGWAGDRVTQGRKVEFQQTNNIYGTGIYN